MIKRPLRLAVFTATLAAALVAALILTPAWVYSWRLTHPGCSLTPSPLPGLPRPVEVDLQPEDGLSLRAWYYPSQNDAAILLLGGMQGALGEQLPPAAFLVRSEYGVLQIDTRACGRPPRPVTLGAAEERDAAAGLRYLRSRPEVQHVGIFGFSMGAAAAIRAAARQPDFLAVVAEGGYFNLGSDFVEPDAETNLLRQAVLYSVAASYWLQSGYNPWQVSPIDDLAAISPRPILFIFGEMETPSGRAYEQFAAAQEPKELWVVPSGSHGRNYALTPAEYEARVLAFFDQALLK